MAKIAKVTLKRFKQLKEFELDLTETTVLIGANNSGKSSALQALHFAVSVAQTAKLVGDGVKWGADKFELSFNPSQLLYSPIADVLSLAHGGQLYENANGQIEVEVMMSDGNACRIAVRRGRNRNIAVSLTGKLVGERLMNLDRPFTVYAPGLAGIAKEERYMSPGVVRRIVARGDANLVLRNVLLMIADAHSREQAEIQRRLRDSHDKLKAEGKNAPHWLIEFNKWRGPLHRFQTDMGALFPGIQVEVEFDKERDENIQVYFTRPGMPRLPIDAAGTSILQASQILAYIALFQPEVLILDEPDSHLHPNNQRALCELITSLAETRGFRALFSTHSRHVLDALRDCAQVVWVSEGKKVDYDSVSTPAMLMELGALDTVDYFAKGHFTCLVATEDSKKESLDALKALLSSNGFPVQELDVRPYAGCSKLDAAKVLRNFLLDKAPNVSFLLHRDRDYLEDDTVAKLEGALANMNANAFVTAHSDVEGYFLNAAHVAHLNPALTVERAQQLIDEATANTREKSINALINIRTQIAIANRNGGPAHNAGELAMKAIADYDGNSTKWRRGKIVLGELKSLLHKELKAHAVLLASSNHLSCPELQAIKSAIWPEPAFAAAQ
ncbi:putative ATPase [Acidovorax sp. KKS102]|uniref:AAA family ATPase n=1 Tax=Acidovorax sp. KKS102 TaxID=358220 RepID=UPI00028A7277|nr:AAA family ATPase [Acidovorax sp. KKS102]AFU43976.1 putative ATPase [Acidovorax sp. KKS102]